MAAGEVIYAMAGCLLVRFDDPLASGFLHIVMSLDCGSAFTASSKK
jgi:hypothetical protein